MYLRFVLLTAALATSLSAHAGLFDDDEARKAILDLRQQIAGANSSQQKANEEVSQLRRSMLDLQNQIEKQKSDLAQVRGDNEQLTRAIADVQSKQKDLIQSTEQRISKIEPLTVLVDGREFAAEPNEKRDYEAAFAVFRSSDFVKAQKLFIEFALRYPRSGYSPSALFWLGNAQYSTRDYKEAIVNFRSLVAMAPDHLRAAEALLSIANCQLEIKDPRSAKKTLEDLTRLHPNSEAAIAAKERLAQLK